MGAIIRPVHKFFRSPGAAGSRSRCHGYGALSTDPCSPSPSTSTSPISVGLDLIPSAVQGPPSHTHLTLLPQFSLVEVFPISPYIPRFGPRLVAAMGHGSEQPYIYDPPANRKIAYPYSDFNPKAVTQASYARLSTISTDSKPKREGPLINFNQHPDSYVIVTGSQEQHKPLNPNTKKAVVSVRWVQFFFRLVQEIGALGLLVATICIKGTSGAETYLLRIPVSYLWNEGVDLKAFTDNRQSAASMGLLDHSLRCLSPHSSGEIPNTPQLGKLSHVCSYHGRRSDPPIHIHYTCFK